MKRTTYFTKLFLNDRFIFSIILFNSFIIFFEGFGIGMDVGAGLDIFDSIITVLFLVEAIVKIKYYSWRGYISSNWNKLDFLLVVLSLPSIYLVFFNGQFIGLEFLLVLRVSRVFKFFRFFKFVPGILHLIRGIRRALKTSIFVLLGFLVFNFIVSVLSCYLFKEIAPKYFGNPIDSFYTTFRIFTVEGWYEIPDKITSGASGSVAFFTKIYFIVILITGGIMGLSLVNSIFVDSMVSDNNDELEKKVDELNQKIEELIVLQKTNRSDS